MNTHTCDAMWHADVLRGGEPRHAEIVRQIRGLSARRKLNGVTLSQLEEEDRACSWIIEALCQCEAHIPSLPLALPRSRFAYSHKAEPRIPFSYRCVTRVIQELTSTGLIDLQLGREGERVSRISAAGALKDYCRGLAFRWVYRPPVRREDVLLMSVGPKANRKKTKVLDSDAPGAARWRGNIDRINCFLAKQCIYLRVPDSEMVSVMRGNGRRRDVTGQEGQHRSPIHFGRVGLHRTFAGKIGLGGRFYGGWWQNVPSTARRFIWINEWQGIECDYSGMALRCLYAEQGLQPPDDPYALGLQSSDADALRKIVKQIVNALLNDRDRRYRYPLTELRRLGASKSELLARLRQVHARIVHLFHTDAGLRMQFVDSQIAERVMLKMVEQGVPCLPIHDSFIVPAPAVRLLDVAMRNAFKQVTGIDAIIKREPPTSVQHFSTNVVSAAEAESSAGLWKRMEAEWNRSSIANEYFCTWADQTKGQEGWTHAMRNLTRIPPDLLQHHAFPLPMLKVAV